MTKKRRERSPVTSKPVESTARNQPDVTAVTEPTIPSNQPILFTVRQYVIMNLVFDAFCILQLLFVVVVLKETKGLFFFFGLLMVGFLAVSILDYTYDRMFTRRTADRID